MTTSTGVTTPHNAHKSIKDAKMSSMNPLIETITDPSQLAFCSYCSLHTTLDNYDSNTQMCLDCKAKHELKMEVRNDTAK